MGLGGGHTWQSCYKAATGVGRPRLQALSEINHPCWPLLAFLLSPHLSFCFSALVFLFNSSSHPSLIVLFFLPLSVSLLYTAPLINKTLFPPLSVCLFFSSFLSICQFLIFSTLMLFAFSPCHSPVHSNLD